MNKTVKVIVFVCTVLIVALLMYSPGEPQPQQTIELKVVESSDFDAMNTSIINVFASYEDRRVVGLLVRGQQVKVVGRDVVNDYCEVVTPDVAGWVACGWLK